MRIIVLAACLLGVYASLDAALYFWNSADSTVFWLHFDGYDLCIEGGGASGMNHIDIPRAKKYIVEILMPHQDVVMQHKLQYLINLLSLNTVAVSYLKYPVVYPNQLLPVDPLKKDAEPAKKPASLTADQKKDLLFAFLAKQGFAKSAD
jgi:hypothetical protein